MFTLALPFPQINPEIFGFDLFGMHIALRWYALAYIVGIFLGWRAMMAIVSRPQYPHKSVTRETVDDLLLYAILGIVIGGRLAGTLIYNWEYYSAHPIEIFKPPFAGMSFHGGFAGMIIAIIYVAHKHGASVRALGDLVALVAPIGIFFGRLANFINAELWGKPTDAPWGVLFPGDAAQNCGQAIGELCARHPSQLYEAALEGLLLGLVLFIAYRRGALRHRGLLIGIFFIGYGAARIFVERFRNADAIFIDEASNPNGYVVQFGEWGLSMGQVLSLPMIFIGIAFIIYARRNP